MLFPGKRAHEMQLSPKHIFIIKSKGFRHVVVLAAVLSSLEEEDETDMLVRGKGALP